MENPPYYAPLPPQTVVVCIDPIPPLRRNGRYKIASVEKTPLGPVNHLIDLTTGHPPGWDSQGWWPWRFIRAHGTT